MADNPYRRVRRAVINVGWVAAPLRRRDAEDLTLMTATRAEQEHTVVSATTRIFVALMQRDESARSLLVDVVPEAFPWVRFLPTEDVRAFVVELVETLHAADAIDNPAPVVQVIAAWQHTAEVHTPTLISSRGSICSRVTWDRFPNPPREPQTHRRPCCHTSTRWHRSAKARPAATCFAVRPVISCGI